MQRHTITPRADWQTKVEAAGLIWHTDDTTDKPYWDESAYYSFSADDVEQIETATGNLYELFLAAGDVICASDEMMESFGIPSYCIPAIKEAWDNEPPALNYGRFDLGYTGDGPPKLFEFNCDTPTSLLEAAVVQWQWKQDLFPAADQFNSLHEKLLAKWKDIRAYLTSDSLYFTHIADNGEDTITTTYLRDLAQQAGYNTKGIIIDDIGWNAIAQQFVDLDNMPIKIIFKLYPWEWLTDEAFGKNITKSLDKTIWIEPIWKMIWSNKAILPILWKLNPNHHNLLEAGVRRNQVKASRAVRKPFLSREGANIAILEGDEIVEQSPGTYQGDLCIYQDCYPLKDFGSGYPIIGSWVVDGEPAGMGIREDGLITGNKSRFIPHIID